MCDSHPKMAAPMTAEWVLLQIHVGWFHDRLRPVCTTSVPNGPFSWREKHHQWRLLKSKLVARASAILHHAAVEYCGGMASHLYLGMIAHQVSPFSSCAGHQKTWSMFVTDAAHAQSTLMKKVHWVQTWACYCYRKAHFKRKAFYMRKISVSLRVPEACNREQCLFHTGTVHCVQWWSASYLLAVIYGGHS